MHAPAVECAPTRRSWRFVPFAVATGTHARGNKEGDRHVIFQSPLLNLAFRLQGVVCQQKAPNFCVKLTWPGLKLEGGPCFGQLPSALGRDAVRYGWGVKYTQHQPPGNES